MPANGAVAKQYMLVTASRSVATTAGWTSRPFTAPYHLGAMIMVDRSSETGTSTMAVDVHYLNPATGTYQALPGATIAATQYPDGTTGKAFLMIYPGITGAEADQNIPLNTINSACGLVLPDTFKIVVTTTGTTNVFSIGMVLLP